MSTRVYKYGLLSPIENASAVFEQLKFAHQYRNLLTEIERHRRDAVRSMMRQHDQNLPLLETSLRDAEETCRKIAAEIKAQHVIMRARTSSETDKLELQTAREKRFEISRHLNSARSSLKSDDVYKEKLVAIKDRANALIRGARQLCGLYWGTYQLVEEAVDASKKMPLFDGVSDNNPRFSRWQNEGSIAVHLQDGGLACAKAFGNDPILRIGKPDDAAFYDTKRSVRRAASRNILHIRIGSDDKHKPIWASFPMIMHRPLPPGSIIKWVKVHLKRIGSREKWEVDITVDTKNCLTPTENAAGTVALDLGWREMKGDTGNIEYYRLGKWKGSDGQTGEIKLDAKIVARLKKVADIKSIRDKKFDAMRKALVDWLVANDAIIPIWLKDRAKTLSKWRSIARLVALIKCWKQNRFAGDEEIVGVSGNWSKTTKTVAIGSGLEGYRYNDFHLWNMERGMHRKAMAARKEQYRIAAAKLSTQYKTLVLEDFDLSDVSVLPEPDEKEDKQKIRSNKTLAAPSELKLALSNAFAMRNGNELKVPAKGTSYTCNLCKSKEKLDHETHIHTCSGCKETWDRDDNAAANILELGLAFERSGNAKNAGGARKNKKLNDNGEIKETRQQARQRGKQEKVARVAAAREKEGKAA